MNFIDNFLNNITMYRLVLYVLIGLLVIAAFFGLLGLLPYSPWAIIFSAAILVLVSWIVNYIFAKVYEVPANAESFFISALILALILSPANKFSDLPFLIWAAVLTMASKYIINIRGKHIFNPVALAVTLTSYAAGQSATWWVGNIPMLPFVVIGGLLIIRKIKRFNFIVTFLIVSILAIGILSLLAGNDPASTIKKTIIYSPWFFFASVMLTEPLTTPPRKLQQMIYAGITGFLFAPQVHFGSLYTTPELALLIGNIYSYLASPKEKLLLKLKQALKIGPDIYDFIFSGPRTHYLPGQYMEWTLGYGNADSRGNRRYFTLASSPTEEDLRIGVKFAEKSSTFKKSMLELTSQSPVVAAGLAGDFILPHDPNKKLAFVAGGIGITPFRSMLKYLIDTHQKRDIVLFYSARKQEDLVYGDVINQAVRELGLKVVVTLTDTEQVSSGWAGRTGYLNEQMIVETTPDYKERTFYISGPQALVFSVKSVLKHTGLKEKQIITDYFPGF